MYVCLCADITEEVILDAMNRGHGTVDSLIEELGVSSGCGTCQEEVTKLLLKYVNE